MWNKLVKNYYTNTAIHAVSFILLAAVVILFAQALHFSTNAFLVTGYLLGLFSAYTHRYLNKQMKELNS